MASISEILAEQAVDLYDGNPAMASALVANGADQVTLYTRARDTVAEGCDFTTRPYAALLEAADCVADVCLLDNDAIKVLVAMYPSAPNYVLLRLAPRRAWVLGSIGLLRRLIMGLVRIDRIVVMDGGIQVGEVSPGLNRALSPEEQRNSAEFFASVQAVNSLLSKVAA